MKVLNYMEDLVITRTNELYDEVKEMDAPWLNCDCEHCRLDTISYALNRLPPRYIVSGRGFIHNTVDQDSQLKADIDTLVIEGMHTINTTQRPYHGTSKEKTNAQTGPYFNFPTFIGSILDGTTFEPLSDVEIILKQDNVKSEMVDYTWANPYISSKLTKGTYSFLVKSEEAEKENISKVFVFTLEAKKEGYESITYNFSIPLISEATAKVESKSTYSLKIQNLFMFEEGSTNELE